MTPTGENMARADTQHIHSLGVWGDRPNRGALVVAFALCGLSGGIVGATLFALIN